MTATRLPAIETETTSCTLCSFSASRTRGEIRMDGQLVGRMVHCERCGLRFLSPRPTQRQRDWLYEQEYHSGLPGEHGETRFASVKADQDLALVRFGRYLAQVEGIRRTKREGRARLLDIGAGTGQLLELARERGWDVSAIERSGEACQYLAGRYGPGSVAGRDLTDLEGAAGSYDAVVMAHVIEHMPDPLGALAMAHHVLVPGGRLLVATPNEASLYEWLWQVRQRRRGASAANHYVAIAWREGCWYREPVQYDARSLIEFQILTTEHLYFFTRRTLGEMLRRAGFAQVNWASGSAAPASSRFGRLVRNDLVNRALFLLDRHAELVAIAEKGRTA